MLNDHEKAALIDRLHGWELVEFLQVTIEQAVDAALEEGWITEDNIEELLEYAGVK